MRLKVFRYERPDPAHSYDVHEFDAPAGMTVLSALFYVQDNLDPSLAFRYSCRGAVCGSCAMLINRVPRLACRTQLQRLLAGRDSVELKPYAAILGGEAWDPAEEVLVEPLPHLPVLKDLVVEMEPFFHAYRLVGPVLRPRAALPERESRMDQSSVRELEKYTNCIMCGVCYGACPVNGAKPDYLGPAALAKLYRFHIDPRDAGDGSRLAAADYTNGWWACEFHANCAKVCPKGVPPNQAIGRAREELKRGKAKDAQN